MVENHKNYLKSKAIKMQQKAKKEKSFKTQNKANGITLIALVITIVLNCSCLAMERMLNKVNILKI